MLKQISKELKRHVPFTVFGAATGIIVMVLIVFFNVPKGLLMLFFILYILFMLS